MASTGNSIRQIDSASPAALSEDILTSTEPLLLKGLVADWPAVKAGRQSARAAADYLLRFNRDTPLTAYVAPPAADGRIFYNDDFSDVNFARTRQPLSRVLQDLLDLADTQDPPTLYVGSTVIDHWLPQFREENDLELGGREHLASFWLGNRSKIAAHFDFPSNIACGIAGRRRFTLFPPDQTRHLYVGPLEFTPSGQPISLVDTTAPDLTAFPNYSKAMAASITVELGPGDALLIPGMWWHHVESLEGLNVLVNYWWRATPAFQGSPMQALHHAIMSLRELPDEQREVWRDLFDYYVFSHDAHAFDHIPERARGILGRVDESSAKALKAQLLRFLK